MSKWIRKGDTVLVIAGNEKGKVGEVMRRDDERVVIQGINIRKKHVKRQSEKMPAQIVEMEKGIHISNVRFCIDGNTPVKLRSRKSKKGDKKEIYYVKDGKEVTHREV